MRHYLQYWILRTGMALPLIYWFLLFHFSQLYAALQKAVLLEPSVVDTTYAEVPSHPHLPLPILLWSTIKYWKNKLKEITQNKRQNYLSSDSTDIKLLCPTMTVPRYLLFISNLISSHSVTDSWQVSRSARMLLLGKDYIFYFFLSSSYKDLNVTHNKHLMSHHTGN